MVGVGWRGVVWCGVARRGVVWRGVVWCGEVWCGVARRGVVWCGVTEMELLSQPEVANLQTMSRVGAASPVR